MDALPEGEVKVGEVARAVNSSREHILEIAKRLQTRGCVTVRKPFLREHRIRKTGVAYIEQTKTLSVLNLKGGVGKTVTAVNLAACLAELGHRTLLVDLDPQANATTALKVKGGVTVYSLMVGTKNPQGAVRRTKFKNLYAIPSEIGLAGAEVEIIGVDAVYRLWEVLEWVKDDYRYIIIDCPPSLSLLSVNALAASDSVLIPVQCDQFALDSLRKLMDTLKLMRRVNEELRVEGILLTMYDHASELSVSVAEGVQGEYGHLLYDTVVTREQVLGEAAGKGIPVIHYKPESDAAKSYLRLAQEVDSNGW